MFQNQMKAKILLAISASANAALEMAILFFVTNTENEIANGKYVLHVTYLQTLTLLRQRFSIIAVELL